MHKVLLHTLTHAFDEHYALIEVSTCFQGGHITALLGPNGAGKSTLMNILSTLLMPSEGEVWFNDFPMNQTHAHLIRQHIGYVGHQVMLYKSLTAEENLRFFAQLYALAPKEGLSHLIQHSLEQVGLEDVGNRPVSSFSRGMAQRLTLARALLSNPSVLLLDEPFTGLDQLGIHQAMTLLKKQKQKGTVVIVSSHDLRIIQQLCDHVVILKRGRLVFDGPLELSLPESSPSIRSLPSPEPLDSLSSFHSLDDLYAHYTLS